MSRLNGGQEPPGYTNEPEIAGQDWPSVEPCDGPEGWGWHVACDWCGWESERALGRRQAENVAEDHRCEPADIERRILETWPGPTEDTHNRNRDE